MVKIRFYKNQIFVLKNTVFKKNEMQTPPGLPRWWSSKESTCQCSRLRRCGFNPLVGKIPWKKKWQSTPVFLLGKSHGQRSLADYSPWTRRVKHDWATEQTLANTGAYICNTSIWQTSCIQKNIKPLKRQQTIQLKLDKVSEQVFFIKKDIWMTS